MEDPENKSAPDLQSTAHSGGEGVGEFIEQLAPLEVLPDAYWWVRPLIIALALVVFGCIAWLVILQLRRNADKVGQDNRLPHELALERFQKAMSLIDQPKEFVTEICDGLRTYLEERFRIAATEQTTEEFLLSIRNDPQVHPTHKQTLHQFLDTADLVKFAQFEPGRQELLTLYDMAKEVVTQTATTAVTVTSGEYSETGGGAALQ